MIAICRLLKKTKPFYAWQTLRQLSARVESAERAFEKDGLVRKVQKVLPLPKYGGETMVTLLTGSSIIGKQAASYIQTLIDTAKVPVTFEKIYLDPKEEHFSKEYILSVLRNRTAIHVDIQHDPKEKRKSLRLNRKLDLYACVFKMKTHPGFNCRFSDVDIIVTAQNNVGEFNKLEYEPVEGMVETLHISSEADIYRYMDFVFSYAKQQKRKRITLGHKRNIFTKSDGLFWDVTQCLWKQKYSCLELEAKTMDELILGLVQNPQQYDVICTTDRFGTMTAAIAAAVCGGASLFCAMEKGESVVIFKPLQTRLSITDSHELSPYGVVKACVELLRYLGNEECAKLMSDELECSMYRGIHTAEFGGTDTGSFVICSIVNDLKCKFA